MGIVRIEGLYTGHPDFSDVLVGYETELCCDCCGEEYDQSELYFVDGQMLCGKCILDDEEEYDVSEGLTDEDGEIIKCCEYCSYKGNHSGKLYRYALEEEILVICGNCLLNEKYETVSDSEVSAELELYLSNQ